MAQTVINGTPYGIFLVGGDPSGNPVPVMSGLQIPTHDYVGLTYTNNNLTGVTYKTGGSGGTTVATLTLAYDGNNNLTSVTKG